MLIHAEVPLNNEPRGEAELPALSPVNWLGHMIMIHQNMIKRDHILRATAESDLKHPTQRPPKIASSFDEIDDVIAADQTCEASANILQAVDERRVLIPCKPAYQLAYEALNAFSDDSDGGDNPAPQAGFARIPQRIFPPMPRLLATPLARPAPHAVVEAQSSPRWPAHMTTAPSRSVWTKCTTPQPFPQPPPKDVGPTPAGKWWRAEVDRKLVDKAKKPRQRKRDVDRKNGKKRDCKKRSHRTRAETETELIRGGVEQNPGPIDTSLPSTQRMRFQIIDGILVKHKFPKSAVLLAGFVVGTNHPNDDVLFGYMFCDMLYLRPVSKWPTEMPTMNEFLLMVFTRFVFLKDNYLDAAYLNWDAKCKDYANDIEDRWFYAEHGACYIDDEGVRHATDPALGLPGSSSPVDSATALQDRDDTDEALHRLYFPENYDDGPQPDRDVGDRDIIIDKGSDSSCPDDDYPMTDGEGGSSSDDDAMTDVDDGSGSDDSSGSSSESSGSGDPSSSDIDSDDPSSSGSDSDDSSEYEFTNDDLRAAKRKLRKMNFFRPVAGANGHTIDTDPSKTGTAIQKAKDGRYMRVIPLLLRQQCTAPIAAVDGPSLSETVALAIVSPVMAAVSWLLRPPKVVGVDSNVMLFADSADEQRCCGNSGTSRWATFRHAAELEARAWKHYAFGTPATLTTRMRYLESYRMSEGLFFRKVRKRKWVPKPTKEILWGQMFRLRRTVVDGASLPQRESDRLAEALKPTGNEIKALDGIHIGASPEGNIGDRVRERRLDARPLPKRVLMWCVSRVWTDPLAPGEHRATSLSLRTLAQAPADERTPTLRTAELVAQDRMLWREKVKFEVTEPGAISWAYLLLTGTPKHRSWIGEHIPAVTNTVVLNGPTGTGESSRYTWAHNVNIDSREDAILKLNTLTLAKIIGPLWGPN